MGGYRPYSQNNCSGHCGQQLEHQLEQVGREVRLEEPSRSLTHIITST